MKQGFLYRNSRWIVTLIATTAVVLMIWSGKRQKSDELAKSVQEQHDEIGRLTTENNRLSNLVAKLTNAKAPRLPSAELLRLRGEVSRLQFEVEGLQREKKNEVEKNEKRKPLSKFTSLAEFFGMSGIDTNNIPAVEAGATVSQVVAELNRCGANLTQQENFSDGSGWIEAEFAPQEGSTGIGIPTRMEVYFENGRMTSSRFTHPIASARP